MSNSLLLREGLAQLLGQHMEITLVSTYAADSPHVLSLPNPPGHVVLLDSGIGSQAAMAWTRHWRGMMPSACVIVLELEDDVDVILNCIEAGAGAYVLRGGSAADVVSAIQQVRQGEAQCSPRVTAQLFDRLAHYAAVRQAAPLASVASNLPLTPRELQVLHYVAEDRSNQEIAEILVIEVHTVKHHIHNILDKLNLRHRWDAARLATEQGWLDLGGTPPCSKTS